MQSSTIHPSNGALFSLVSICGCLASQRGAHPKCTHSDSPSTCIFLPGCRYQFVNTRADIIPTINLSKKCPNNKCSKPINAPFDKTKYSCQFSWVNFLENGTWHEKKVTKFQETFQLQGSDYSSDGGYMYSLEVWFSKWIFFFKLLRQG